MPSVIDYINARGATRGLGEEDTRTYFDSRGLPIPQGGGGAFAGILGPASGPVDSLTGGIFSGAPQIGEGDVRQPQDVDYTALEEARKRALMRGQNIGDMANDALLTGRSAPTATAAQIDRGQIDAAGLAESQTRGIQGDQIGRLTAAAEGRTTSAAELQQRRGIEQAIAGQSALANSARGGAAASVAAQRQAQRQAGSLGAAGAAQGAILRAQEQATARNALTDALNARRTADMARMGFEGNVATANAGFENQVNMLNPRLELEGRRIDDSRGVALLGAEMERDKLASMSEIERLRMQQAYQDQLLRRDLGIAGANMNADMAHRGAVLNAAGTVFTAGANQGWFG